MNGRPFVLVLLAVAWASASAGADEAPPSRTSTAAVAETTTSLIAVTPAAVRMGPPAQLHTQAAPSVTSLAEIGPPVPAALILAAQKDADDALHRGPVNRDEVLPVTRPDDANALAAGVSPPPEVAENDDADEDASGDDAEGEDHSTAPAPGLPDTSTPLT